MTASYKPLWKLLIDRDMQKEDLRNGIKASSSTMAKLSKNELVSMQILLNICEFLNCNISDIMTFEK